MRVGELLELHGLLETGCLLPEETLPRREGRRLEERVLQDRLDSTEGLDDVGAVCVQIPQLPVVPLARPPERVALHQLVRLELGPGPEALVEAQRAPVLLEERVDAREATVPAVLEIFEGETPVLLVGLLSLLGVLRPHALGIDELGFPRDDVPEDVRDQRLLVVGHTGPVMGDAGVGLLRPSFVACGDEDVGPRYHAQTT